MLGDVDRQLISAGTAGGVSTRSGEPDWESPAGPGGDSSSGGPSSHFVFVGPGDDHWLGQRCEIVGAVQRGDAALHAVVLACGCRVSAPHTALRRTRLVPGGIPRRL